MELRRSPASLQQLTMSFFKQHGQELDTVFIYKPLPVFVVVSLKLTVCMPNTHSLYVT